MQKIISLSISLFCFTHFLQSCETEKPTLVAVIYAEEITSREGDVFSSDSRVCISPQIAESLPLVFNIKNSDETTSHLKLHGFQFSTGNLICKVLPQSPESLRLKQAPQSPDDAIGLVSTTPIEFSRAHFPLTSLKETRLS